MENKAFLLREKNSNQGIFGHFFSAWGFNCKTIELPYKGNTQNISCIPAYSYEVEKIVSNKYGKCFWVKNVSGRSGILFHNGNFAGDSSLGYKTHSLGCILVGQRHGYINRQKAVLNSKKTFNDLVNNSPEKFILEIKYIGKGR